MRLATLLLLSCVLAVTVMAKTKQAADGADKIVRASAAALAAYCARHGVRGGFVCHDESEDVLLVSEDGFSEDPKAVCWRLLDAKG